MHLIDMFEKLDEKSKQPQDAKSKLLDFEKQVREMAKSQGLQPRTFLQRIAEKNSKIANNRVIQHLIGEQDVPTQKGRDAKPNVLTPRAMNTVKKQIKKDANKQRRIDSKSAIAKALHDDTEDDYGYAKMIINQNPKEYAKMKQTGDLMDAPTIYDKLFQYFAFDPSADEQMPYGTAKARDGDPYVWIADKLAELGLDEGNEFAQKVRQMKAAGAKKGTKFKTSDGEEHTLEQDDTNKKAALEAWYYKYNKYKGNNGDDLADGFFEAYLDTGILTDATETNEFAKAVDDVFGGDTIKAEEELFGNEDLKKKHLPITYAMHEEFEKIMGAAVGATSPEDMEDNVSKAAKILGLDEGMAEDGSSHTSMNKYGLSARNHKGKFYSYKDGKMTGVFDSMEELARHQEELIKDESVEEAPFGAVKKAINKAKRVVGKVPGLGDIKTKADAEANIGQVANDVWKDYLQFKQTDPDPSQVKGWFKTNHGMDVEPDSNSNVDKDDIIPGIKQAMAAKQSKTQATPDASPQDAKDVKVKLDLLKKSDPNANAATMVAIKKMAAGDMVDPTRQQALQPLVSKIAKALNNPGKANLLSRALAESLSQSDLSKLDMLARQGMVPKNRVARFKTAMRTLSKGKDLPISYKDDVIEVVMKLAKIITKPSVMGMVRKGLKEEHKQTAQEKFKTWVNQADDIIS